MKGLLWTLALFALFAVVILLTGCATDGEKPLTPEPYFLPITKPCVQPGDAPTAPAFADSDDRLKAAKSDDEVAADYAAGRAQHYRFEAEQGAVIAKCSQP